MKDNNEEEMIETKKLDYSRFSSLFAEFGIKSKGRDAEEELLEILESESHSLPCSICGIERDFDELSFEDGDPICKFGCSF